MKRPQCRRCKGPLDIWHDEEQGIMFICNNPGTIYTDEQFQQYVDNLPGDEVAALERLLYDKSTN